MNGGRLPCTLTVQPWFCDHAVGGRIVLAAVETMLFLAARGHAAHPDIDVRIMEEVRFGKFLLIPPAAASMAVLVEWATAGDGRVQAKLLSHSRIGTMARIKEHGEIFFARATCPDSPPPDIDPAPPAGEVTELAAERLYRDLVPFGPTYRTLQGSLYLAGPRAWGELRAPDLPPSDPVETIVGSPFPLDGALHAACVLGQQAVPFVPFPVGFARRTIHRPTRPGGYYLTRVTMIARRPDELLFDLDIFTHAGQLCESVRGVRMRDVAGVFKR
jgi:hypothetical protein